MIFIDRLEIRLISRRKYFQLGIKIQDSYNELNEKVYEENFVEVKVILIDFKIIYWGLKIGAQS